MLHVDTGIAVEEGVFVSGIEPGSAAAVDDTLIVGDRLLSVSLWFSLTQSGSLSARAVCFLLGPVYFFPFKLYDVFSFCCREFSCQQQCSQLPGQTVLCSYK